MQLSVIQTITSTESDYKANVNFGIACLFQRQKKKKKATEKNWRKNKNIEQMKASSLTPKKWEEKKII